MSKLPPPTCKEVKDLLLALGFVKVPKRRKGSSHEKFRHPSYRGQARNVTVDCPKAPFSPTLIGFMAAQAGLKKREFWEACVGARCPTTLMPES